LNKEAIKMQQISSSLSTFLFFNYRAQKREREREMKFLQHVLLHFGFLRTTTKLTPTNPEQKAENAKQRTSADASEKDFKRKFRLDFL
jgi:hypothetical protein